MKGFTLLEVLLSIAIIAIMVGISVPVYQSFQVKNDTTIASITVTQTLRRAQVLAQGSDGDSTWGVKTQTNNITLFKGATFETRDTTFDESFELPSTLTPSGVTEVTFSKMSGLPIETGSLVLTSTTNEAKTVTINSKGMVDY